MKIALFNYVTGLADIVRDWATVLVAAGDEVHVIVPQSLAYDMPSGAIVHTFSAPSLAYRHALGDIALIVRAWHIINRIAGLDLIHTPEYLSTAVFTTLGNIPVVLTVPGNIYERIANGNPFDWQTTQVYKLAAAISARRCEQIIVTSLEMREWWMRTGCLPAKLSLLPYGVNTQHFRPIPDVQLHVPLSDGETMILFVGRLSPEKGVHHLITAMRLVIEHIPGVKLYLVGDGSARTELTTLTNTLGLTDHVVFCGWVHQRELPAYYSSAAVTVLPSFSEGLPRVMLEAMACGSLFVGTRITGI